MELKEVKNLTKGKEFPEDWQITTIDNCCTLINGRGFKPFEWRKEGLPIIRIQNLNGSNEFNYYDGAYDKKIEVEPGELLFAWSGSRGTSFGPHVWNGEKGVLNYHTWKVVINETAIDKRFFFHALKVLTKEIENNAHGASALVHTQKWVMEKMKFASPSKLDEQNEIANSLSDMDELIIQTERLIDKKKLIKQGLIQELLIPYEKQGKLKEGWKIEKLGEWIEFQVGFPFSANFFNRSGFGTRLIKNRDLKSNDSIFYYNGPYDKLFLVNNGDVLVGMDGEFNTCLWTNGKALLNQRVGRLVQRNKIDIRFLYYYLRKPLEEIQNRTSSTTVKHLSHSDIEDLIIPLPSYDDQFKISKILSDIDNEILQISNKMAKLLFFKQSMMQSLLTGKIRIHNPAYEPSTPI